jgi:stress response protein YsnF
MTKTVIGTYEDMQTASAVVNDLVKAGFDRNNISIIADNADDRHSSYVSQEGSGDDVGKGAGIGAALGGVGGLLVGLGALAIPGIGPFVAAGPIAAALAGAGIGAVTGGVIGALVDLGIPEEEAHIYSESIRHGNVLVAAQVPDNQVAQASRIMERTGLVDIERHAAEWRRSGQPTSSQTTSQTTRTQQPVTGAQNMDASRTRQDNLNEDETIEIIEEDVHVGKRTVEQGGVRVRTYVREVPVEEQVRLREEHVEIERRPVDRPANARDLDNFREGTVEMTEKREEAVIGKEARVVEEVRIHKDVDERTETVRDSVRRTEVEVEQLGSQRSGQASNYEMYDSGFRTHWQSNYANSGQSYDRYQPAYRYGYTLANDDRYRGRNWNEIESDVRRDWESRNQGPWENFKDSIRYSWDNVRGKA